jgi:regulatory protein
LAPPSLRRRRATQKTSDATTTLAKSLRHRPLSEREAQERLEEVGFSREEIDAALAAARDHGWIDDRVFARLWVEDRMRHHPLSRRALEEELRGRKVPHDVISAAVRDHYPQEQERDVARALAVARLARLGALDEMTRRRRTIDFLIRRGFSSSVAADSVRRALRGKDDE